MNALALAASLEAEIQAGHLPPGTRLPTHRALAFRHGVAVNTATRAMRMLAATGLVVGEVGRGTFVRAPAERDPAILRIERDPGGIIDLTGNVLPLPGLASRHARAAMQVLRRHGDALADYQPHAGMADHRAAAAAWLARSSGLATGADQTVICAGAQHAITVALMATTRPGDALAVEALTWPGIKAIADALRLRLVPIAMDAGGLRPSALLAAARRQRLAALFCMPNLQNPTSATLSAQRRAALVAIARRHDIMLIEDDAYGFLQDPMALPLAALAPERCWHVHSTSKSLLPALRAAWLVAPAAMAPRAAELIRATIWMAPPMGAAIAAHWIADGTAAAVIAEKRREAAARQRIAAAILPPPWKRRTHPASMHLWLETPRRMRGGEAVDLALQAGVRVAPGAAFACGAAPNAVRLALGRLPSRAELRDALTRLVAAWGPPAAPHPGHSRHPV